MITFGRAVRSETHLMLGLAGPSRAGKTFSALRMATGLANGGKIVMIDTESGRGLQYADKFVYDYGKLEAPFTAERYQEAILAAKQAGAAVIIVDSVSHLHEGPGGVLEQHEKELDRMAGTEDFKRREKLTFAAWIKPKASVNRLVNTILQVPCHFIFCFRAKDKLKLERGKDPVQLGWTPICTDRFEYEMTSLLVLPEGSRGTPDLQATSSGLRDPFDQFIQPGVQLDENLGRRLAQWAAGTSKGDPVDWSQRIRDAGSLEALKAVFEDMPQATQATYAKEVSARKRALSAPTPAAISAADVRALIGKGDYTQARDLARGFDPEMRLALIEEINTAEAATQP